MTPSVISTSVDVRKMIKWLCETYGNDIVGHVTDALLDVDQLLLTYGRMLARLLETQPEPGDIPDDTREPCKRGSKN